MRSFMTPEKERLLLLSLEEVQSLKKRPLKCPECQFTIQYIYEDARGHVSVKCKKCGGTYIVDMEKFRTLKIPKRYYISK